MLILWDCSPKYLADPRVEDPRSARKLSRLFRHTLRVKIGALSNIIKIKSHLAKSFHIWIWYVFSNISMCIALADNPSIVQTEHFRTTISSPVHPRPPIMPLRNRKYFFPWIWFVHIITWHFDRLALISEINPKWHVGSGMVKFYAKNLPFMKKTWVLIPCWEHQMIVNGTNKACAKKMAAPLP